MPFGRRSTAALLAALSVTASLVAGCSKSEDGPPLPDAAPLLKQSAETTRNVKSAHVDITVGGEVEGLPIETLSGDLSNAPAVAAKGHAKLKLAGGIVEADFVVMDGTLYGSLDPGQWTDFGAASNIYDVSMILNPDTGLANILSNFTDPKADGRETVGGVQAVRITGKVSADAVNKIAPDVDVSEAVPATAWIREDGNHDLVQAKLEPSEGNTIQMTLSKWNEPVSVEKPPL